MYAAPRLSSHGRGRTPGPQAACTGRVGLITQASADVAPKPGDAVAITSCPPIMIKSVLKELDKLGFKPDQVITTLEGKMKCGVGKCQYICRDGPVFRYDEIRKSLEAF